MAVRPKPVRGKRTSSTSTTKPFVSIIILNYNGKRFLRDCLNAVLLQTYQDFEILLVDNGSCDGSIAYLERTYQEEIRRRKLRIIAAGKNLGFTGGNNLGVRRARGELIVILNNDTIVTNNWLRELLAPLTTSKEVARKLGRPVGIVTGVNIPERRFAAGKRLTSKEVGYGTATLFWEYYHRRKPAVAERQGWWEASHAGGTAFAFRKQEFPEPYPEVYFAYAEDIYHSMLARLKGMAVVITTAAQYFHYGGATSISSPRMSRLVAYHGAKNEIANFFVLYETKTILKLLPLFLIYHTAKMLFLYRKLFPRLRGAFWVLTHIPTIVALRRRTQAQRRVSDAELLRLTSCRFFDEESPLLPRWLRGAVRLMNLLFLQYCRLLRVPVLERQTRWRLGRAERITEEMLR